MPTAIPSIFRRCSAICCRDTSAIRRPRSSWSRPNRYAQMMDSAEKGKAYDQAIMPIQMVSQVPYFQREVRRALLPSITLKEVLNYRANLKTRGVLN